MGEVKPCPFCGSEAARAGDGGKLVYCPNILCFKPQASEELWNRRADDFEALAARWEHCAGLSVDGEKNALTYEGAAAMVRAALASRPPTFDELAARAGKVGRVCMGWGGVGLPAVARTLTEADGVPYCTIDNEHGIYEGSAPTPTAALAKALEGCGE